MPHILLIDDDPNDRLLTIRELEREFSDLQVTEVTNAIDLETMSSDGFDLVITDYQLRWTTGLKIIRGIKSRTPECPVIMFTNTGNEEVAVEAMKAGLDDYIIKSPKHYQRVSGAARSALARVAAQRQLARLEQRLQSLLNQLNVGVFRCDSRGYLLESNNAFLDLLNVETLAEAQSILQEIFVTSMNVTDSQEIQLPSEDDQPRWILLTQTRNQIDDEIIIDGIIEDITARKQAEATLLHLNESLEIRVRDRTAELAEVNAELRTFAYSISHDLRSPLRTIKAFSQILLADYQAQLAPRAQDYLQRIVSGAGLMNTLIENLLDYSQLSRAKLQLEQVNLSAQVLAALAQVEAELQQQNAQVTVVEPLPTARAHGATLVQILINLLINAIKFVAPGVKPNLRIWAETEADFVVLYMQDNGIGIAPENQEKIFGVFERLHSVETYPGTGIGLALVRKGSERMGAEVKVESKLGQGSRFAIKLQK